MNPFLQRFGRWLILPAFAGAVWVGWRVADDGRRSSSFNYDDRVNESVRRALEDPEYCEPGTVPGEPAELPPTDQTWSPLLYPNRMAAEVVQLPVAQVALELHSEDSTAEEDIARLGMMLAAYQRALGAMPQGDGNGDFIRRMTGKNPRGVAVLPESHPDIDSYGELEDRWGTPYYFHSESAHLVIVRSAGPDQRMYTPDDLVSEGAEEMDLPSQRGIGPLVEEDALVSQR